MNTPITSQKLTKRFFMNLTEGLYLSSNTYIYRGCPAFSERVAPSHSREQQWRRIISAAANGRLCNVFVSKAELTHTIHPCIRALLIIRKKTSIPTTNASIFYRWLFAHLPSLR